MHYGRDRRGFTLVEILIVTAILSVVALAVYKAFSDGVVLWKRINVDVAEEDMGIFFSDFAERLGSTFRHGGVPFHGERDRISFPAIVPIVLEGNERNTVGQVAYLLDEREHAVYREEMDYSDVYEGDAGGLTRLVKNVKSIQFSYFCRVPNEDEFVWVRRWTKEAVPVGVDVEKVMPIAVRVEVRLREDDEDKTFSRTVAISVGG